MNASPTRGSGPSVDRQTVVVAGSTLTPALDPDIFVPGAGFDPDAERAPCLVQELGIE